MCMTGSQFDLFNVNCIMCNGEVQRNVGRGNASTAKRFSAVLGRAQRETLWCCCLALIRNLLMPSIPRTRHGNQTRCQMLVLRKKRVQKIVFVCIPTKPVVKVRGSPGSQTPLLHVRTPYLKTRPTCFKSRPCCGGTAAAVPPPFRPGKPALCGTRPLVTPY